MFSVIKSYNSACPTTIHWDLEKGVVSRHSLRFAGGVTSSHKQWRGKRGLREGGGHRKDEVAVKSALWRTTRTHKETHVIVMWRSDEQKVRNLRRQFIMRPKVSYTLFTFCVTASLNHAMRALNVPPHTSSSCSAYISVTQNSSTVLS